MEFSILLSYHFLRFLAVSVALGRSGALIVPPFRGLTGSVCL